MELKGGVWSLDGAEEILQSMSTSPEEPSDTTNSSQPPAKVAKTSITFCGIVPLPKQEDLMTRAHELGVSLAQRLLQQGADKILSEAKAQNAANAPNVPPKRPEPPVHTNGEEKESIAVNSS